MKCSLGANRKRGERGNAFKVVNHRGQLGHLQSELVNPLWPLHVDISVLMILFCESMMQPLSVF